MRLQAHGLRRLGGGEQLVDRPFLPFGGLAVHGGRREGVECLVIRRMDGDELSLEMGRELGDLDAVRFRDAEHLVAIGLRLCRLLEVEDAAVPARDLHALVAERRRPFADGGKRVERRRVARELGKEDGWPLDVLGHVDKTSETMSSG